MTIYRSYKPYICGHDLLRKSRTIQIPLQASHDLDNVNPTFVVAIRRARALPYIIPTHPANMCAKADVIQISTTKHDTYIVQMTHTRDLSAPKDLDREMGIYLISPISGIYLPPNT